MTLKYDNTVVDQQPSKAVERLEGANQSVDVLDCHFINKESLSTNSFGSGSEFYLKIIFLIFVLSFENITVIGVRSNITK